MDLVVFNACVMEYGLNKFANSIKLFSEVDTLERRDAIQSIPDRLERWACAHIVKLNNIKCKISHMSRGSPKCEQRLGKEWTEGTLTEKDLEVLVVKKFYMTQQSVMKAEKPSWATLKDM